MSTRRITAFVVATGLACAGLTAPAMANVTQDPLPLGSSDLPKGLDGSRVAAPRVSGAPERQAYLLKLNAKPTVKAFDSAGRGAAGRQAAKAQLQRVESVQDQVIEELPAKTPVIYRTHALLSGVAVRTNPRNVTELEAIPGVTSVHPITPKRPSLSTSIPLQGGPTAWQNTHTGAGVKVAIIDTGVDYTHADFGGPGTKPAFEAAKAITDDSWITSKVVDGYDLVGDDYDGVLNPTPQPDENPLDCNGHGTHVAGIAAGQGVNADGSTYADTYDQNTDVAGMRIGPGMAPEAQIVALRVFGCDGSTEVVTEALDRAVDPDQNGSPSDRVDVVNMSLGSDYGSADEADSLATDAAVDAGIVVVASAGNGGDLTDIAGSPGNAPKAVSVANSVDGLSILDGANLTIDGNAASFGVTRAGTYDWETGPDLTGEVVQAPSTNPDACEAFEGSEITDIAGKVVLVTWTQEALECGSAARGANLEAAGATGFIFANSAETFDAGIVGDDVIPGVLMVASGGDAIRAALQANKPVTVDGTAINSVVQGFPENTDKVSNSSSRGIHEAGNVKPDIAAVGDTVFSAASGTGNEGISETGTSMAAPTVAGLAALVRQVHPTWTPEQVKAAMMNTATDLFTGGTQGGDMYAPIRVGAGRIQADPATTTDVVAYVSDDPGAVSISFGPVEVSATTTLSKTVTVANQGATSATYATSYEAITEVAGTSFSVSPASVTVPAGATQTVTVTFQAQGPAVLDNTVDPTIGRWSNAGLPRTTLAEASGRLLLTPASGTELRLPVYAAPRPVSSLMGGDSVTVDPVTQKAALSLQGKGLGFGGNGTADEDATNDITSIGGAFELAAQDPAAPQCATPTQTQCYSIPSDRAADVRRVGITSSQDMVYVAVTADKPWTTPSPMVEFDVLIDGDGDRQADVIAYSTHLEETDVMVVVLEDAHGTVLDVQYLNGLPGTVDTAQYDSDTMILPISKEALAAEGIDGNNPRVNYGVMSWSLYAEDPIDFVGVNPFSQDVAFSADLLTPGLRVVDNNGQPVYWENGGTSLSLTRDPQVYQANGSQGLMLVHLHNAVGAKSEVISVLNAPGASTTTLELSPSTVQVGGPVTASVTVTGVGPAPTGQVQLLNAETAAVLAAGTLDSTGKAALSYSPGAAGAVRMVARYAGDSANSASVSAESLLSVQANPGAAITRTALTLSPKKVVRGKAVTAQVSVTGGTGTGSVSLVDHDTDAVLATGQISGGKATLRFTPAAPQLMTLQALYSGDLASTASASSFAAVRVQPAKSKLNLGLSRKSGQAGDKVTASIVVKTVHGISATGRVRLLDNGRVVARPDVNAKGKAKATYKPLGSGNHTLRAVYSGDRTYKKGTSKKVSYQVR